MVSGVVIKVKLNGTISPPLAPKKHYLLVMMVTHKKKYLHGDIQENIEVISYIAQPLKLTG